MECGGSGMVDEVIYETRQHATGVFLPQLSGHEGSSASKSGLLSYFSVQGAKQLKKKWNEYRRSGRSKRNMALFVSSKAEHVAVAFQNQLVILQKADDYMKPCGTYISNDRMCFFTNGAWMEPQAILGVIDDMNTLYLIDSNGREIARWTRNELKLTSLIIDLIIMDYVNSKMNYQSVFGIFTADGSVHSFEVTKEPKASIFSNLTSNNLLKDRSAHNVSCIDFHPDLSLIVLVDAVNVSENPQSLYGFYSLYLFRMEKNSDLELVFCSPQFKGLFSCIEGRLNSLTSPKVSISPQGKYIAALDLTGCLDIFSVASDSNSLSILCFTERLQSIDSNYVSQGRKNNLKDIMDICWWTDHVLILANTSGSFTMYDVVSDMIVLKDGPHFFLPVTERHWHSQGHVFVLEGSSYAGEQSKPVQTESKTPSENDQLYDAKLCWNLLSISKKSVLDMYRILTYNQQYHSALEFADHHGLDKDEVFKAQWLNSSYGTQEVDLFLSKIGDRMFVLQECLEKVGSTEDAVKALLTYGIHVTEDNYFANFNIEESPLLWDFRLARLQLLQYRDKLETFVGINMGRFLAEEYRNFRIVPLTDAAVNLAESGKIGALHLLFKRHAYSLSQDILHVLSAIPETVPVQSYGQLLPGKCPHVNVALRERDWVECEHMVSFIDRIPGGSEKFVQVRTENIMKLSFGFVWPSISELVDWYTDRARDIDVLSGQLENCLALVEFACRKDISELQQFFEDITYLHQLIYCDGCAEDFNMGLVEWVQLPDYDKFKLLLNGITEDCAVKKLQEKAIPFMHKRYHLVVNSVEQLNGEIGFMHYEHGGSFLVRWMKEVAADNRLGICLKVIEDGCRESSISGLFKDENELVGTALECIYSCTLTDQWNVMACILSKLPRKLLRQKTLKDITPNHCNLGSGTPKFSYLRSDLSKSGRQSSLLSLNSNEDDYVLQCSGGTDQLDSSVTYDLEKRIINAEGHVDVGRLLAYYQVPKPISFFLSAESDEKNVKQLLRLIFSKFGRRQPGRSDNEWANMWTDMLYFQEKSFPFLDTEYILIEFCRGLLKAGKFSLARNYLKGTGNINLATEKAEMLVVQAAREYFFSASSLTCSEVWKARECLNLFPNSKIVHSEDDVIEALTVRLPNLGVTLLPMQYRQIRNPMEIINAVILSQTGAYLHVEEIIEVAKLLGLGSPDDIAAVEEAIARESVVAGDLQLASDLCLVLAKEGHGPIWDLCATIARSPHVDNIDTSSRKQLLGFALSHCDVESIGELLNAWKDVDMIIHYEQLIHSTETCPPNFSVHGSTVISLPVNLQDIWSLRDTSKHKKNAFRENGKTKVCNESLKSILSEVAEEGSTEVSISWDSLLRENRKVLSFAALELPWLIELSSKEEYSRKSIFGAKAPSEKLSISIRFQALTDILQWLVGNDFVPRDELLVSIAKSIMVSPVTEEDDVLGCSFLLNLLVAFHGVEVIEEQLKQREKYQDIYSIMNIGMSYSSIQYSRKEYSSPVQRRELLHQKFREKYASFGSDEVEQIDKVHSTFWREWKLKLEDQKRLAHETRVLEETVPGVNISSFLSADIKYIRSVLFSLVDSVKTQKKHILKEVVKLADTYGLQRVEVLLRFFGNVLVSEHWGNDDILAEISEYRDDVSKCAKDVIELISTAVFPEINGHNKCRLSYVYSILSACYLQLRIEVLPLSTEHHHQLHKHIEPFQFYKVLEQECQRVSFIENLDFKNIAMLIELNYENFNQEILNNIHESTVETLAVMVRSLVGMYVDTNENDLMSWEDVYRHHILKLLTSLESQTRENPDENNPDKLQVLLGEIDVNYDHCKKYIRILPEFEALHIIKRFQKVCIPCISSRSITDDPGWRCCLIIALDLWIKLLEDTKVSKDYAKIEFSNIESLPKFLNIFKKLVMDCRISVSDGWCTIYNYVHNDGPTFPSDITYFFRSMIFSGCRFTSIADVYFEAFLSLNSSADGMPVSLPDLYISLTESALSHISHDFGDCQNLHRLLSSLSKVEGSHMEELLMIRSEVWRKMSVFFDNLQQESNLKLYGLELMQCITGQSYRNPPDELISEVAPWEDCYEFCQSNIMSTSQGRDTSSNITSTLVALKSNQLIAAIMPHITISAEDLIAIDSAVSCFQHLCEAVTSPENVDVLRAVLEEWEVLFSRRNSEDEATSINSSKEHNEWNSNDWDEGWETLHDELIHEEEREYQSLSIRPLHACWMEIVKMLITQSRFTNVLDLLDKVSLEVNGLLLDEDEANSLFRIVVNVDSVMALKFLLLLPYDPPRLQCLQTIESNLKERGTLNISIDDEFELLILVFSSGLFLSIILDSSLRNFFSYVCYLVGHLARICQEGMVGRRDGKISSSIQSRFFLLEKLIFPCFIAELVQAKQFILAAFILSQWMHTDSSLGLLDIVEPSLTKYLECQLLQANNLGNYDFGAYEFLQFTLSKLSGKLSSLVQSALSTLTPNM